jgi:hypothetical protein
MFAYELSGILTKETQMQNLGLQREQQLGHMWLGQLSVCSERGYSDRFEPTSALRVGEGWDD